MKSDDGILNLSRIENKKVTSLYRYEQLRTSDGIKLPESSKDSLFSNRFQNSTSAGKLRRELQAITMNPVPNIIAHLKEENQRREGSDNSRTS